MDEAEVVVFIMWLLQSFTTVFQSHLSLLSPKGKFKRPRHHHHHHTLLCCLSFVVSLCAVPILWKLVLLDRLFSSLFPLFRFLLRMRTEREMRGALKEMFGKTDRCPSHNCDVHSFSSLYCSSVSAPGKALIAGGYLVLEEPNVGIVVSCTARFYATVTTLVIN